MKKLFFERSNALLPCVFTSRQSKKKERFLKKRKKSRFCFLRYFQLPKIEKLLKTLSQIINHMCVLLLLLFSSIIYRLVLVRRRRRLLLLQIITTTTSNTVRRRKNPHPKRAVNARTVLKGEKEEPVVFVCSRIPEEEDELEVNHHHIQKEETTVNEKGVKRKRTQQHECDVCEKCFRQASHLQTHMRIHTNEKPYECDVCERSFRHSNALKDHMRIHTKEKPYECNVCKKRFRHSGALKNHMRIHTNEKPYECDVCDKKLFVNLVI